MRSLLLMLLLALISGCSEPGVPGPTNRIEDYRGQWLAVNYWAKWCKPCIKEIPELNALHTEVAGMSVLGVNFDGATGEELASQIRDFNIQFPVMDHDPSASLPIDRPVVLPTTFILDPDGEVVQTLLGPQTLESLLAATPLSTSSH